MAKAKGSSKVRRLPKRSQVKPGDTWDLSSLYESDEAWEQDFQRLERKVKGYAKHRGKLGEGAKPLAACIKFDLEVERLADRLGVYAYLKTTEDQADSTYQGMLGRYQHVATRGSEAASFIRPEILSLPDERIQEYLAAGELAPYRLWLERMVRFKPHTLSEKEEQLLAMQGEMAGAASKAFRQLTDADLKFGLVENEKGERVELSQATFSRFLKSPQRSVRKNAFHQFYEQFSAHENTLAATLSGSIHGDIYYARARGFKGALAHALFPDNVPQTVYDNLIKAVKKNLPAVHRFYELRRKKMRLKDIHHYDTYVPILSKIEKRHKWNEAVAVVADALAPLGDEYCRTLRAGLSGRWCDRYPNEGKQSGAFSYGSFDADPYILMNYKEDVLNDVFTLAHEAGHSMHSWYSARHQPYQYHNYTIFVAEVASTFNEQLLGRHLLENADDDKERAYLINTEIDDIRSTLVRQTMFAEFEKITHEMAEAGEALTLAAFRDVYRKLLEEYFGPQFVIDEQLSLECLRIPHFYRAFYVYKYATGMSAAIALSRRVLGGGNQELADYLGFLKAGCSKYPLDILKDAGVDMERPQPVDTALRHFADLVEQLEALLS